MAVTVIGTGKIGSRLVERFAKHNIDTIVASHELEKAQAEAEKAGSLVRAMDVDEAIQQADMVVFATWFDTTKELLQQHAEHLKGKIIVDPSNNIGPNDAGEMESKNPDGVSAADQLVKLIPEGASYVKAFGTLSAPMLEDETTESGDKVTMFYATDDDAAGDKVAGLIEQAGWDAVKAGGIADAKRIEVFGDLHPFGGLNGKTLSKQEATEKLAN